MRLVRRKAVRIVLLDLAGSVLTLSTRDASNPEFPMTWELPGGGIEPGESVAAAAVREVFEETGICIAVQDVGPPLWCREVRYHYRGQHRLQDETIVVVRLSQLQPRISPAHREPDEIEDHQTHRWWHPMASPEATDIFYPRNLIRHLPLLLAGMSVDDPLEKWD